jgi:hypothetical protein
VPHPLPVALKSEADMRSMAKGASLLALLAVLIIGLALLAGLDALTLIEPFWRSVTTLDLSLLGSTLLALLGKFAPLIPVSFYLLAVLGAAGILDQIGKGEYFSARNIRALSDMGGSMLWGAAWAAFVAPAVAEWVAGRPGYRFLLEPEILVIGIIGMSILVIGRLFARAQQLESEMGEIL